MTEQSNGDSQSNTAKKLRSRANLKPFGKGYDPRRNLKGRPRTFDALRDIALDIANERDKAEKILREWANSLDIQKQKAFIEYAFGKVPDKIETSGLENRTTLVLHWPHERPELASRS